LDLGAEKGHDDFSSEAVDGALKLSSILPELHIFSPTLTPFLTGSSACLVSSYPLPVPSAMKFSQQTIQYFQARALITIPLAPSAPSP
jgi:hypothetical protein